MAATEFAPGSEPVKGNKKLLIIALALGLIAAAMNWIYLTSLESSSMTVLKVKTRPVLAGTPVSKAMFEPIKISGNIKQLQSLVVAENEFAAFDQKPLAETLQPGQLLLLRSFELSGDNPVRDSIRPGERALSLNVADEASAVAYFVRPGDSVDVWGRIGGSAYRLKERACVKAIGELHVTPETAKSSKGGAISYRTITVVVADSDVPNLIQNVALAGEGVTLSLVGPCDPNAQPIPAAPSLVDPKVKPSPGATGAQQPPGQRENSGASATPPAGIH